MVRNYSLKDTFKLTSAFAIILIIGREGLRSESWLYGWGLLFSVILIAGLLLHVGDRLASHPNSPTRLYILLLIVLLLLLIVPLSSGFV